MPCQTKIPQVPLPDYTRFLESLIDADITDMVKKVGKLIVKGYRSDWGYCCYKMEDMAEWLGITRQSVHSAIKYLEQMHFIEVIRDITHKRNKYIPLFGHNCSSESDVNENGKVSSNRDKNYVVSLLQDHNENKNDVKNDTHSDVNEILHLTIENTIDSLPESTSVTTTPKDTKKPIAHARRNAQCAKTPLRDSTEVEVLSWRGFHKYVVTEWPLPRKWDEWAFKRSVGKFILLMRRHQADNWSGLRHASRRLNSWLEKERYTTEHSYVYKGLDDWIES